MVVAGSALQGTVLTVFTHQILPNHAVPHSTMLATIRDYTFMVTSAICAKQEPLTSATNHTALKLTSQCKPRMLTINTNYYMYAHNQ